MSRFIFSVTLAVGSISSFAQEAEPAANDMPADPQAFLKEFASWQEGPGKGSIGGIAEIDIPAGFWFTGSSGTQKVMELFQNPVTGNELGMIGPAGLDWFVVFEFNDIGYVKDDDRESLDADALMKSMKAGNKEGNKQRESQGWPALELIGWMQEPNYDPKTNNLNWGIRLQSEGQEVINHNTRLLGRKGVMEATLVAEPEVLTSVMPTFNNLLAGYQFTAGNTHGEFRDGDKIAEYGLAALVAGGAAAVALKMGLLQKFWKLIVVGLVAVGAFFKKIMSSIFGRREVRES
ncbi:MAG: DUF2167 domain-containing protein [Phycisphaerae bacterium]